MAKPKFSKKVNATLLAVFLLFSTQALACEFPIPQERQAWIAKGLTVSEIENVPLFMSEFQAYIGETTEADQVFVLSKGDLPNVLIVFAVKGCASAVAPMSAKSFRAMAEGLPA
jgi:hypothetical protein